MANYTLHISLVSDLDVWWEVSVVSIKEFKEVAIDDMPTTRLNWSEMEIKNEPFSYKGSAIDRYRLYDFIMEQRQTTEIRMKLVYNFGSEIKGYFGLIDCNANYDAKTLTVTLAPLDDYTTILENREKEVNVFQDANVVRNGMFSYATGGIPDNWTALSSTYLTLERLFVKRKTAIGISELTYKGLWDASQNTPTLTNGIGTVGWYYTCDYTGVFGGIQYYVGQNIVYIGGVWVKMEGAAIPSVSIGFHQTITSILSGKQLTFSFLQFLSGTSTRKKKLTYDIFIFNPNTPTVNYRLKEDGTWTGALGVLVATTPLVYDGTGRTCVPLADIDNYHRFIKHTAPAPISGTIEIRFYRPVDFTGTDTWDINYKLIITNVELSSAEIPLKTIQVQFSGENLVTLDQSNPGIFWENKRTNGDDDQFYKWGKKWASDTGGKLSDFINTDGSPNLGNLGDVDIAPNSEDSFTFVDLVDFFKEISSPSYKFELSEITIYKGKDKGRGKYWYGIAKFSREEYYKLDAETYVGSDEFVPPAEDSGWERIDGATNSKDENLWVRTPFNDLVGTWNIGTENIYSTDQTHDYGFTYEASLSTKKAYPIDTTRSIAVETAIDLRDFIQKVYRGSHPDLLNKNVYSTFFWNDEDLGGVIESTDIRKKLNLLNNNSGCNYVTMSQDTDDEENKNLLNNIAVIHTFDLSDEKSFLKVTFKKLMDDLMTLFRKQIYWFIDSSGHLHIEHLKYFDRISEILDLTVPEYNYIRNFQSWKYDKAKMFSLEEFKTVNSGMTDFATANITFDRIASNKRGEDIKVSYGTQLISTDIQYCIENAEGLDNGIVLVCYEVKDGQNVIRYGKGQKSGLNVINGELSISSLLGKYGTYEGTWEQGKINGMGSNGLSIENDFYNFKYTSRTRVGKEITIKGIFTENIIQNSFGGKVSIGRVLKTIDFNNQNTKMVAYYRYSDNWIQSGDMGDDPIIIVLPAVMTNPIVSDITGNSAICGGTITSNGGGAIIERGICYSPQTNLNILGPRSVSTDTTDIFTVLLTGLTAPNYYFRAYATNSKGTSYGGTFRFSTLT